MTEIVSKWFYFSFIITRIVSGNEATSNLIHFGTVLDIFSKCQVNIHNYDGIPFAIKTDTPLLIHTNRPSRIESDVSIRLNLRLECKAVFHLVADRTGKKLYKFYDMKKPRRQWYQTPLMDTKSRYDILVGGNKNTISLWMAAYLDLIKKEYSTIGGGLILNINKMSFWTGQIILENTMHIVNKFSIFREMSEFEIPEFSLKEYLQSNGMEVLNKAIEDVNDVQKNFDIPWSLFMFWDMPAWIKDYDIEYYKSTTQKQNSKARLIRDLMRNGKLTTLKMLNGPLNPKATEDEGLDNYLFAFTILGSQVNLTEFGEGHELNGPQPAIMFNMEKAQVILDDKPKRLAFLSCSTNPIGFRVFDRLLDVAFGVVAIFDKRIWLTILVSYAIIPLVLGYVFHKTLKKNMRKDGWILWHPFTWGLRTLIRQAGDRILNSQRFGWTFWMVAPLLLMSVVISHAFLGENLDILRSNGYWYTRNPLKRLYNSGVKLVTDYTEVVGRGSEISTISGNDNMTYNDIGQMIQMNSSIAYISFEERVMAISNMMKGGHYGKSGMCTTWNPVTMEVVRYYADHSFSSSLNNAKWDLMDRKYGWEVKNWIDNRILGRINRIKGESQIVSRWKDLIKWKINMIGRQFKYGSFVTKLGMAGNFAYVFQWMTANLFVALLAWGFEWIVWEIHTKPSKKRKKLLEDQNKEVKENEDKCVNIENEGGEKGKNDDLVNEALDLVEETRNKSAGNDMKKEEKDLQKKEDKLVEELNEDEEHLVNIIDKRIEDCSDMSDVDRMDEVEIEAEVLNGDVESLVFFEDDGEILAEYGVKEDEDSNIDEELKSLEVGSGFNSDVDEEDNDKNDGLNLDLGKESLGNGGQGCAKDDEHGNQVEGVQIVKSIIDA